MDSKLIIALMVLAHILTDFVFQTQKMASSKHRFAMLFKHVAIGILTSAILLLPYLSRKIILIVVTLFVLHFIIDFLKTILERRFKEKTLAFFLWDQALHIAAILACYPFFQQIPLNPVSLKLGKWLAAYYPALPQVPIEQWYSLAIIAAGYILNIKGGTIIVRKVLEQFSSSRQPHDLNMADRSELIRHRWNTGAAIGVLERLFILTLVLRHDYAAIGLVLTGKSLVRFQEFKVQEFAEYYLVGTLTSMLLALATGLLLNALLFSEHILSIFRNI